MQDVIIEPSVTYEKVREQKIEETTAVKIYGVSISPGKDDTEHAREHHRRFVRILGCVCVQDSPDNPCPCDGPIIWIPTDKILNMEKSDRKNHDGQKLAVITVAKDAQLVVERQSTITAGRFTRPIDPRHRLTRSVPMRARTKGTLKGGGASGTAGAILGAFLVGYELGTKIDEATGASDAIADFFWDLFHDDDD